MIVQFGLAVTMVVVVTLSLPGTGSAPLPLTDAVFVTGPGVCGSVTITTAALAPDARLPVPRIGPDCDGGVSGRRGFLA